MNLKKAVLYVPKASLEAYRTADDWKNFKTIAAIEEVGDINGNGKINIADVSELINMLLSDDYDREVYADVNLDGKISIADVSALINILLSEE